MKLIMKNLNTSYVKVQLLYNNHGLHNLDNLNTSYVKVQLTDKVTDEILGIIFKYILC